MTPNERPIPTGEPQRGPWPCRGSSRTGMTRTAGRVGRCRRRARGGPWRSSSCRPFSQRPCRRPRLLLALAGALGSSPATPDRPLLSTRRRARQDVGSDGEAGRGDRFRAHRTVHCVHLHAMIGRWYRHTRGGVKNTASDERGVASVGLKRGPPPAGQSRAGTLVQEAAQWGGDLLAGYHGRKVRGWR